MLIIKNAVQLQNHLNNFSVETGIGFVPTMGALHLGHISLIKQSIAENEQTICSIFINPTQFNDPNDLAKYPVSIESDIELLEKAGCTILYLPSIADIYPNGTEAKFNYELGDIEQLFEGQFRPGHFQGVCQVVDRLLQYINPSTLYLGQKDYQQCLVLTRLIELKKIKCKIQICPTYRESNGLAMSSRNMRLSNQAKEKASAIFKALEFCKTNYLKESPENLIKYSVKLLQENGFLIDYFTIADAATLTPVATWNENQHVVAIVAAYINEVRLIDNMKYP